MFILISSLPSKSLDPDFPDNSFLQPVTPNINGGAPSSSRHEPDSNEPIPSASLMSHLRRGKQQAIYIVFFTKQAKFSLVFKIINRLFRNGIRLKLLCPDSRIPPRDSVYSCTSFSSMPHFYHPSRIPAPLFHLNYTGEHQVINKYKHYPETDKYHHCHQKINQETRKSMVIEHPGNNKRN